MTNITAEKITTANAGALADRTSVQKADFSAHTNPSGTWIDFGKLATDGAVKINREARRLVVFPYPRDKEFSLSLDLKSLAPAADPTQITVRALAANTQQDLGPAQFKIEKGRLLMKLGKKNAGRYAISW